jgi:hypothetical protein
MTSPSALKPSQSSVAVSKTSQSKRGFDKLFANSLTNSAISTSKASSSLTIDESVHSLGRIDEIQDERSVRDVESVNHHEATSSKQDHRSNNDEIVIIDDANDEADLASSAASIWKCADCKFICSTDDISARREHTDYHIALRLSQTPVPKPSTSSSSFSSKSSIPSNIPKKRAIESALSSNSNKKQASSKPSNVKSSITNPLMKKIDNFFGV